VTKEQRDKQEAGKKARMDGEPDLGGVTLPFSRAALLKIFWGFALLFPSWTIWNARQGLDIESVLVGTALFTACLLPCWFWVTGRIGGLPIFPIFGLTILPGYVTPLWQGHSLLAKYSLQEINTAAWTMTAFLLIAMLFWQQVAVRAVGVPQAVRMIDMKKSEKVLLWCLIAEVVFELGYILFYQLGGGTFAALRGFAGAAGRMGLFVFSYKLGQDQLSFVRKNLFLGLAAILIVQECTSLLLASALPTLGILFAGYVLGSGKLPWKTFAATVGVISILHAGKFEMRAIYHQGGKQSGFTDLPVFFVEWFGYGIKNLTTSKEQLESQEVQKTSSAKERAAMIPLMIQIQTTTPIPNPYLEGQSYEFIPSLLIPRILSPTKGFAHTGNMLLSLHYGILDEVGIFMTSVGFDPVIEAYANFGYLGVGVLAILFGLFIGMATRMTINVPMLSFGFLFGVQVIAVLVASWNTAGVLVTSLWQSFLALLGLSIFLMSKQNNPVWKYYTIKLAEKLRFKKDPKNENSFREVQDLLQQSGVPVGAGTQDSGSGIPVSSEDAASDFSAPGQEKHVRPTRYVYGGPKK